MKDVALALVISVGVCGCIVQHVVDGPRVTGTCDGACDHYVECKPGHAAADGARCRAECPGVFADRDSLMGYEQLTCEDAVSYVDGDHPKAATAAAPRG
jgi:hypothetical protein|nr:hypothetical protein [Kofleriaceae bacterium]